MPEKEKVGKCCRDGLQAIGCGDDEVRVSHVKGQWRTSGIASKIVWIKACVKDGLLDDPDQQK